MLRDLQITDLALIEDLALEFGPGLNIITGETGAGKSLLQRAVAIALGARAGQEVIRTGADAARIEAHFDSPKQKRDFAERMTARGVPDAASGLHVRRAVSRRGRGQVALNDKSSPLAALTEVGSTLAQLQGQHESLRLAQVEAHLGMLDDFAGTASLAERFASAYAVLSERIARLDALDRGVAELARRLEVARYDLAELEAVGIEDGEEAMRLENERLRLRNGERLAAGANEALERLHGAEDAALAAIEKHAARLRDLSEFDPSLAGIAEALEQAAGPLGDGVHELQSYVHGLEADPQRLEDLEERLALFDRLQRKHGVEELAGLLRVQEELGQEIERSQEDQANPEALRQGLQEAADEAWTLGEELSAERRAAAGRLGKAMADELAHLGMAGACFSVEFQSLAPGVMSGAAQVLVRDGRALGPDGPLRAEFLLEANPGEGARPLARVASGGELSRLMLGLRNVTGAGSVPTLVFDEVDAGIGGAAAEIVGQRLRALGERHQVICITHLAQIATYADRHYAVEKGQSGGRTRTAVRLLEGEDRVQEIARMLGDADPTDEALRHAEQMLARAGGKASKKPRRRAARATGR